MNILEFIIQYYGIGIPTKVYYHNLEESPLDPIIDNFTNLKVYKSKGFILPTYKLYNLWEEYKKTLSLEELILIETTELKVKS